MIRAYHKDDQPTLIDLIALLTPKYFAVSEVEDYQHYLEHEVEEYFVFEHQHTVIGGAGINYFQKAKKARLSWDMIHPDHLGRSIGTKLMEARLKRIKDLEWVSIIEVRTSQLAHPFYEKFGFELIEIQKDYWSEGLDLYLLNRSADH